MSRTSLKIALAIVAATATVLVPLSTLGRGQGPIVRETISSGWYYAGLIDKNRNWKLDPAFEVWTRSADQMHYEMRSATAGHADLELKGDLVRLLEAQALFRAKTIPSAGVGDETKIVLARGTFAQVDDIRIDKSSVAESHRVWLKLSPPPVFVEALHSDHK
jgi:hypothetical protein